jgi:metal-sulfur cluster biosynthetic enzyme
MTLTAPACPVADILPLQVKKAVLEATGANRVEVELVWDPPWGVERMSEEARLQLGL